MCAEALTQEEIDALLRGDPAPEKPSMITPEEEDTINKVSGIVANCGGDVLSTLLGEAAQMTMQEFKETDPDSIESDIEGDLVIAELSYKGMLQGKSVLIVSVDIALGVAAQMTGGGADSEFGDLEETAFSEAVQSIFSTVNTQMAQQIGGDITLDSPDITTKPDDLMELLPESPERLILVTYQLDSGAVSGPVYQIIPRNLLHSIANGYSGEATAPEDDIDGARDFGSSAKAPKVLDAPAEFGGGMDMDSFDMMGMGGGQRSPEIPDVDTQNLGLILDIFVEIKVELGRTQRKIREVLELGPGSVVELDQLAGEPIDILVNDKLFAKGEVVVIDENFGVRITDILTIDERLEALK